MLCYSFWFKLTDPQFTDPQLTHIYLFFPKMRHFNDNKIMSLKGVKPQHEENGRSHPWLRDYISGLQTWGGQIMQRWRVQPRGQPLLLQSLGESWEQEGPGPTKSEVLRGGASWNSEEGSWYCFTSYVNGLGMGEGAGTPAFNSLGYYYYYSSRGRSWDPLDQRE